MPRPIQCILLVDDDPDDNFLHEMLIADSGLCDRVQIALTGEQALHYLTNPYQANYVRPDLILTDINMPGMNGFEFLEQYQKLDDTLKSRWAVLILTTSSNPDDTKKASLFPTIQGYCVKPLTDNVLHRLVDSFAVE